MGADSPFSLSGMGGRLGAGLQGIYRKRQRAILFDKPPGAANQNFIVGRAGTADIAIAYVTVPSARIRVGILVGCHQQSGADVVGNLSYWQIWPGKKCPEDRSKTQPPTDGSDYLFGQAVFGVPSTVQPQSGGAGYFTGPNVKSVSDHSNSFAGSWPGFYEAQSIATIYRVEVGVGDTNPANIIPLPVFIEVDWEIIDPRDGEDSQALLAGCSLDFGTPTAPTGAGNT